MRRGVDDCDKWPGISVSVWAADSSTISVAVRSPDVLLRLRLLMLLLLLLPHCVIASMSRDPRPIRRLYLSHFLGHCYLPFISPLGATVQLSHQDASYFCQTVSMLFITSLLNLRSHKRWLNAMSFCLSASSFVYSLRGSTCWRRAARLSSPIHLYVINIRSTLLIQSLSTTSCNT